VNNLIKPLSNKFDKSVLWSKPASKLRMAFESSANRTLRQISLGELMPLYLAGTIDPIIIEQKVIDLTVQGAEFIPIHDKIATFFTMESEKVIKKVRGYDGKKIRAGRTGAKPTHAGGYVDGIEFDCSYGKKMKRVAVAYNDWEVKQNWNDLAEAIVETSQVIYDDLAGELMVDLETDVHTDLTDTVANWGNSHYKACMKMFSLIAAEKMHPDAVFINPTEVYDMGIEDFFINSQYNAGAARMQSIQKGFFGTLFPNNIPIYYHYKVTTAKMTMLTKAKSAFVGVYQPLTVESFRDVVEGRTGATLAIQYDYKNGSNAQKTKPTQKSWAVATSA
jgi:hypothetical protein